MNIILSKAIATLAIGFASAALVVARRWRNKDQNAGYGVAGWAVFTIVIIWIN